MQSRIDEVQELYDKITNKLYTDREAFGEYLRFSGKFYKTPAVDTMMIFESNPDADMVADFFTWQKFGHYVRRNERSIAVPTQDGKLKHYFDISQTNGKKIPYRWSLDKDTAQKYLQQLSSEQQREFKSLSSAVDYLSDQAVALRATEIRRKYDIPDEQAEAFDRSVCTMVRQVVAARCGYESSFKYKSTPIDYTAIDMLHGNRMPERMEFEHLAGDIQQTAKSVLLEMEKSINTIIQQRSIENEYERQNRERHQTDLVRGGQEVLPRNDRGERQEVSPGHRELDLSSGAVPGSDSRTGGDDGRTDRQIRESVAEIYGGEPPRSDTIVSGQNEMVYNSQGGGQGSGGALSDIGGELRESEQPSSNGVYGAVSLGENEDNDLRTPGDGGYSSSVQSISEENRAIYSTNTATAEEYSPAVALFKDYATTQLTYYDIAVREAFLSGNKQEFKSLATKYLDNLMADVVLGTTEIEGCDRAEITKLYAEMYEDFQVRVDLYDEILKSTYAAHEKNNVARQFAKENNIPFDEYPYDADEDFDPYAYNPNRMSDESYDRLHQLLEADKYLEEELLSGQGLVADGKFTIEEHYHSNNQTPEDFGKKLYEFYGDGGHNAQGDLWYIKRSEEGITFKYRPDLNKDDISFSWTAIAQRTAQLLDEGKYITQDDLEQRENRAELLRETEPTTESDQPDIDDTLHAAFETVKAEYSFSDKANEFLDRAERQMSINGYQRLEPQMFKLAVFAQNYGTVSRIDEKLFDGKLKEVIGKINSRLSPLAENVQDAQSEVVGQSDETVNLPNNNTDTQNFHITDDALGEGGLKTKFTANIEAIKTLKLIEAENRTATPAEQEILSKYVGWGGMPQAFDSSNQQWTAEYRQLKELLTPEEYEAAAGSTLNAHYTSPEIIRAMYKAVSNMGFKDGNILEPAMGVGNFFGCIPDTMQNSKLYGVELDSITGRIAQQLYPDANIQVKGYEKTDYPDNFFDLAIGNVPFGNYGVADKRYDSNHFLIHDYFFAKTLDKVAPGGVVAFVTSKGTLDKANPKVREYLAKRADLVGAIRLPNTAFKANANTEVTSDIIFLQKREKMAVETPDWCYTAPNADGISINQYFIDNPDMVLGKMEYTTGQFGQEATCTPIEGANLAEQLDMAVTKLKAKIIIQDRADKKAEAQGIIPATDDVRNFTHALIDGKLYFRENNIMTEVEEKGKTLQRKISMHELRNTMRELIDAQTRNCSDEELQQLQQRLNTQYDKFYTQFGSINSSPNSSAFREDDDYNTLCSLEIINPETKEVTKAAIFTQRTIKPVIEITAVETAQEAMQVALDVKGRIDIPYMAQLCSQSPESVCNELLNSGQIFLNPEAYSEDNPYEGYEEASEYLSGNVREKLKAAEQAAQIDPTTYSRNAEALKEVLPPTIGAGEITARIGVSWVDTKDYELFLREYAKATFHAPIRRTPMGEYKIEHKTWDNSVAATSTYGTSRMSSYHIFEQLLNNRDVAVRDKVKSDDGKERYVINRKETQLAAEKARQMKEAFAKWLWADPARRQKYVERYNVLFNSIVGRHYDGSHQTFPGMSPHIQLNPHQKDAVARAKYGGNTLLAHCVGAGKSFEMVAATMEKKRLGLINKACVVVPKHLVGQTANEWLRLYPDANILVATEKDFEKNNRQKFIARCCTGDYAAVIMSYEQFEKIPMSLQYREQFLRRELNMLTQSISQLDPYRDRTSIKDLERAKKRVEARISKLLEGGKTKDTSLSFEQLGFDSLVVDEAHHYKNGLVISKMNNVSGVQTTPAEKSEDILMKTQYLNETTGHKNILFATGTPVTNSMTELYTMQRYLRPDLLEDAGLQNFDDWASTFGEVVSQLELKPAGDGFRTKKRFAKFANLPELMQMYKEFADIRTAEMLKLPVPEIQGGKAQTVVAKPNEFQQAYMQILAERSEAIHNGTVDPTVDNMLKITHEARLLGLDARCLNPEAENYPDSKVNMCIDNIIKIYNDTTEQKGVQAVFCDIAVNDDNGRFSVYDYIRDELVRRGIPADEICAAGDAHNQKQRSEMYAQLRSGAKRIVLASTTKMGTGANIQTRLAALHHLDIPWKPSEVEPIQRNFL